MMLMTETGVNFQKRAYREKRSSLLRWDPDLNGTLGFSTARPPNPPLPLLYFFLFIIIT